MGLFWGKAAAAALSIQLERLREAERVLIELAFQENNSTAAVTTSTKKTNILPPEIQPFDTLIPMPCIMQSDIMNRCLAGTESTDPEQGKNQSYKIHAVSITSQHFDEKRPRCDKPLVLLHGYMNGGAYFYRNFLRLGQYFTKIYALDQLGWGLSSRPSFSKYFAEAELALSNNSSTVRDSDESEQTSTMVRIAETFFVESLEAWRKAMNIDSMVLAGHSMGGLIAVAYTEKYPQHVHQLILISPVGVPEETQAMIEARTARTTWRFRLFEALFPYVSPGDILRSLPESIGKKWIVDYVIRRLPTITAENEQTAVSEYLYCNNGLLPGSGEYCLPKLLKPSVFGRIPLVSRIPLLRIHSCSFLYGETDWMDANGGLGVEEACLQRKLNNLSAPNIDVYQISRAGHLLMLENSEHFNNGLILASLLNEASCTDSNRESMLEQLGLNNDESLPSNLNRKKRQ